MKNKTTHLVQLHERLEGDWSLRLVRYQGGGFMDSVMLDIGTHRYLAPAATHLAHVVGRGTKVEEKAFEALLPGEIENHARMIAGWEADLPTATPERRETITSLLAMYRCNLVKLQAWTREPALQAA